MAVKNLQTLIMCVANKNGVRVTGMGCNRSLPATGKPAHFLFLLWHPQPGLYPIRTGPDAMLADETAMAQAIQRAGRSERGAGNPASIEIARSARWTVLSERSAGSSSTSLVRG